ncbi:MAG: tRNA uridine-5-carboxymethylaminomethyl(34) synthesis GTPase MnmE [Alphaproteobacteria bacterium]|nr:tRNA uridine-5-carboxymethylaminomethyl(34) synthesis GTPase MnmE [Alphaproteobacteria bacterium]
MTNKTIYALSTVNGKSGVAIIRVSGAEALAVVKKMTELDVFSLKSRYAYFTDLKDIVSRGTLDKCLLLYFKAPNSFTGEDIVELHLHGSKAVISSVIKNLSSLENFRMAEAGEFSKRAFYNNKMDLTEAEGLADLIDAETSEQQKFAIRQMEGSLSNLYETWREALIKILAHLEAYIDFPDEEIPDDVVEKLLNNVFKLQNEIKQHLESDNIGERLREGFRVVIVGAPNAGKSSLLNNIAKREVAIVSNIAGTTRDAIDIHLDLKGYPVVFTDTAGLRETIEEIEQKGIEIAKSKVSSADLVICLFDGEKENISIFDSIKELFKNKPIVVANKCDKLISEQCSQLENQGCLPICAKTGEGVEVLLNKIYEEIEQRFTSNSSVLITRARYREYLSDVLENLELFNLDKEIELSAEDIRLAARSLGKITGRIEVDDILDKIFGDFCIGK